MIQKKQIKKLKHKFNNRTLAQHYPQFRKYIQISNKGETIIDYKNQNALNELNKSIMDYYFGIREFTVPLTQMIPALGCRLNYIEWVKEQVDKSKFPIIKIYDVGTGFSGVLIFLAYRLYGWKGIGVDTSEQAINHAQSIAQLNHIECEFKVGDLFQFLQDGMVTVCNPPFYDDQEEREYNRVIQNQETFVEGGEVSFVKKMIQNSNKNCIYTTMLGRKSSLNSFQDINEKTELHQGNNIRFALSWNQQQEQQQQLNK
ncbi:unnamed protein product [Paramecium pentaurelia]|uniref:Methyltransferase small domain-containing protein n=1 Tax=Paramecium pentaurelia TaxID=43138 RepID=A0A8S1V6Z2_9CILI|nr:unnamed protein product [Paramecium pentaurelia]